MMTKSEYCEYEERVAIRLRFVASTATTAAMKARLLEQAEKHDRLARGEGEAAKEVRDKVLLGLPQSR
jgi:hypothetical protein